MNVTMKSIAAVAAILGSTLAAQSAMAGCGPELPASAAMKPMLYRSADAGQLLRTDYNLAPYNSAAITGLWKFAFTAMGNVGPNAPAKALPFPDGTPVDAGYVTWHDDGTELMNSSRAPASGSFCMGVWKQIGREAYKLNHWAISWVPDYHPGQTQSWSELAGGTDQALKVLGPTNIQEIVALGWRDSSYTGTFRLTQYVNDGTSNPIHDISAAPVAFVIVGTITATRINP